MSPDIDLFKDSYILVQIVCGFLSLRTLFCIQWNMFVYVHKCVHRQKNRKETKHEMYICKSIGLFTVELVKSMIMSTMFHIWCRVVTFPDFHIVNSVFTNVHSNLHIYEINSISFFLVCMFWAPGLAHAIKLSILWKDICSAVRIH